MNEKNEWMNAGDSLYSGKNFQWYPASTQYNSIQRFVTTCKLLICCFFIRLWNRVIGHWLMSPLAYYCYGSVCKSTVPESGLLPYPLSRWLVDVWFLGWSTLVWRCSCCWCSSGCCSHADAILSIADGNIERESFRMILWRLHRLVCSCRSLLLLITILSPAGWNKR